MMIIWKDPKNKDNYLTVEESGRVNYYYMSSFHKKEGASDPAAVLRAAKAWKTWIKQNPGNYWCAPARPELERFYRKCFHEVVIKKQNYCWWKLIVFPLLATTVFVGGLGALNNIYLNSSIEVEQVE